MSTNKGRTDEMRKSLLITMVIILGQNHQLKLMSEITSDEKPDIYIVSA